MLTCAFEDFSLYGGVLRDAPFSSFVVYVFGVLFFLLSLSRFFSWLCRLLRLYAREKAKKMKKGGGNEAERQTLSRLSLKFARLFFPHSSKESAAETATLSENSEKKKEKVQSFVLRSPSPGNDFLRVDTILVLLTPSEFSSLSKTSFFGTSHVTEKLALRKRAKISRCFPNVSPADLHTVPNSSAVCRDTLFSLFSSSCSNILSRAFS